MADEKPNYRLRAEARRDMQDIWRHTRARWGLHQAAVYHDELERAFLLLSRNPKLGVSCGRVLKKHRKKPVGRHIIYYRADDGGIVVTRVLHGHMQAHRRIRRAERN